MGPLLGQALLFLRCWGPGVGCIDALEAILLRFARAVGVPIAGVAVKGFRFEKNYLIWQFWGIGGLATKGLWIRGLTLWTIMLCKKTVGAL